MNRNYPNTSIFPSERGGDAVSGDHELQEINIDLGKCSLPRPMPAWKEESGCVQAIGTWG